MPLIMTTVVFGSPPTSWLALLSSWAEEAAVESASEDGPRDHEKDRTARLSARDRASGIQEQCASDEVIDVPRDRRKVGAPPQDLERGKPDPHRIGGGDLEAHASKVARCSSRTTRFNMGPAAPTPLKHVSGVRELLRWTRRP